MATKPAKKQEFEQVEWIDPEALKPNPRNSRTHTDEQITALGRAMQEFGFTQPVLIDGDNVLLIGHGRAEAAKSIGLKRIPCIRRADLSEAQKRALVISDNRLGELGSGWDEEILREELQSLMKMRFDVTLTGFEVPEIMPEKQTTEEDDTPAVGDEAISVEGDIWILGDHRLACGSSTDAAAVAALLDGAEPFLMVTDPPYGVEYDPEWRNEKEGFGKTGRATGKVQNDDRDDWREAWALFKGSVAYVWHSSFKIGAVEESLKAAGFEIRAQIIWQKEHFTVGRGHYHWQHEPCFYAVRKGRTSNWLGGRSQSTFWKSGDAQWLGGKKQGTIWEISHRKSWTGHGTQKPVEAMRRPMLNHTLAGDLVYEPFSGSGTTIIAGETCSRRVMAIELDPLYVDVAVRRWENFTGKEAINARTERTFAETAADNGRASP